MRKLKCLLVTCSFLFFVSCASNPKTTFAKGDFCGLVVDENNKPVKEFVLEVNNQFGGGTYVTSENGVFRVPQIETGAIWIKGKKKKYTVLEDEIEFLANQNIFCWQVKSLPGVLDEVKVCVKTEQYNKALNNLESVYFGDDKEIEKEINFLKKKIKGKIKEVKKNEK